MGENSQLPWNRMSGGLSTNVMSGGLRVARCDFDGDFDHPSAIANAELIVRCVNAHDSLVAALEKALIRIGYLETGRMEPADCKHEQCCCTVHELRAALQQARP